VYKYDIREVAIFNGSNISERIEIYKRVYICHRVGIEPTTQ